VTPHVDASGPSKALLPVSHAPLDLILVVDPSRPRTRRRRSRRSSCACSGTRSTLGSQRWARAIASRLSRSRWARAAQSARRRSSHRRARRAARRGKFVDEICYRPEDGAGIKDELVFLIQEEKRDAVTAINMIGVRASANRECRVCHERVHNLATLG
jgi:hypothetical protein